ncbi:TetR/AcrR family transcriptional regulator [Ensifer sp. ENS10]|uniref:TetR/AcrR family transcriptional regulator n=1 Tax=unclassified Ensifer TaxID=2633371 RepID=UPI000A88D04B|nr:MULTISPECIES: TetR/AcrR family transcriptional regulator [unclassified Ensifer]MBD9508970.1 TetR/AcrR family transcriptional regulator [Ensifer sp. ENS10]MBV7521943.1 TetR/AcrR family transcriptional regulator [Ensifer sp. ENS12]
MQVAPKPVRAQGRTQQERREKTRADLLEGMMSALIELGYARTTTGEITRRAGLTSGALQHHFPSREDLILALVDYQFEAVRAQLEIFANDNNAESDWKTFIELLRDIYAGRRYMAIWEIVMGTRADVHLHALLMQHRIQSQATLERLWSTVFKALIPDKRRRSDLMHFTLSTLRGSVFYNVIAPDAQFLERQKEMLFSVLEAEMCDREGTVSVSPIMIHP